MITTKTPCRITFCGGGSDYPSWYTHHGGVCVNATINKHAYLTVRRLPPFFEYKTRLSYSEIECVKDNADIRHAVVRESVRYLGLGEEPLEIAHYADMPGRCGLGSSSAFAVGLLHALSCLTRNRLLPDELAEGATHVERELLKENVGRQDQLAAAHGGLNILRFYRDGTHSVRPLPCDIFYFQNHLLLFFTRTQRTASTIAASYANDLAKKTAACFALMSQAERSIEAIAIGDYEGFGTILNECWRIKRGLSSEVTNPALDDVFNRGRLAGAWGGKLLGAGGGGCFLFVAPPEKHEKIRLALKDLLFIPFRLTHEGSTVIHYTQEE